MSTAPYEHVVLISLDTLRSDGIAANPLRLWEHEHPTLRAPRTRVLDDLAAECAFFANAISAAPYTSASHATYFTGKWPLHHGVFEFFNRKLTSRTIFRIARQLGYRTIFKSDFPIILGDFLGFTTDVDDFLVEDDDGYLATLDPSVPTVSFVHFAGLHTPYGFHNLAYGGEAYRAKVAELEAVTGSNEEDWTANHLIETFLDPDDRAILLRYKRSVQFLYQARRYADIFQLYLDGIEHFLERRFAPFLARLRERLARRRTLFVLFGDHGEEYDDASFAHFNSIAEGVLRVPVLVFGDDIRPGVYLDRMRTVDVLPTIVDLALPTSKRGMDGVSLAATVLDGAPYEVRDAFAQAHTSETDELLSFQRRAIESGRKVGALAHHCAAEAVYRGDLKLSRTNVRYVDDGGHWQFARGSSVRLERLGRDGVPQTLTDRRPIARLSAMLDLYNTRVTRSPRVAATAAMREDLRANGYPV